MADAFSTAAIGVGIGLSPFLELELAFALVLLYLAARPGRLFLEPGKYAVCDH